MSLFIRRLAVASLSLLPFLGGFGCASELGQVWPVMPEARSLRIREPEQLPKARIPEVPPPPTVSDPQPNLPERNLSLDEAIHVTLANTKVVRVLAGVTAVSSGKTIYDAAITNTTIDQQQGTFDPTLQVANIFNRTEPPLALLNPFDPNGTSLTTTRTDDYSLNASLTTKTITGATASLTFTDNLDQFHPGVFPLNPQNAHATTVSLTQPLLQGGGIDANLAPIMIARLNTEQSYYQFKDSMQESVRGVAEAYWQLVFARTDAWARQQQVQQGQFAYDFAAAKLRQGLGNEADVAQSKLALAQFKAILVVAEANVIQREDALRNIIGLSPSDGTRLVPVSPPTKAHIEVPWDEIIRLAEERRPDLMELKLQIQVDQQLLLQANNQALPKVDAVALYRFNGLAGKTPTGAHLASEPGQFTDYSLGLNVSLPLYLRSARALLRQEQLTLARDQAGLDQGLHAAIHDLATSTRSLAQDYEQFNSLTTAREAAEGNLRVQAALAKTGKVIYLNVLQAITDWGNTVSAQAQALALYNTDLANLEKQSGTILETHGIHFFEERYPSIGPCGRLFKPRSYPESTPPGPNVNRYPTGSKPAENTFDLRAPIPTQSSPSRGAPEPQGNGAKLGPVSALGGQPSLPDTPQLSAPASANQLTADASHPSAG